MGGEICMTALENERAKIFLEISQKKISQAKASKQLGLSIRQVQRLYAAFLVQGIPALVSRQRGRPSNHQLPLILKVRILELVTCEQYRGFGPTFMCEKLLQLHYIRVSVETTRQLMMQSGVWNCKSKKRPVIHQQRKRRSSLGELVQIDGSPHHWFEDRSGSCTLIVYIDDATGRTYGQFFESETTLAYMLTSWKYIIKYGVPKALYSDKHGIFRINKPGCIRKENFTQFGRAVEELGIHLICANSPQAKGRVERANQTLQDRLVKELRLAGISTIEDGNIFLETFWDGYNHKFNIAPSIDEDAHRLVSSECDLSTIFCFKHQRKLTKNLELQYNNTIYQILLETSSKMLRGAEIRVLEKLDGSLLITYKGKQLPFQKYGAQVSNGREITAKEVDCFLKEEKRRKPSYKHPWRQSRKQKCC